MAVYSVELADGGGSRRADGLIVSASSAADAKAIAKSYFTGDGAAAWDNATVTTLADVAQNADDALVGWRLRVAILDHDPVIDVTVTGDATDDDIDALAAAMVTALNATSIDNASYNSTSQVLTVATGSGGDDIGDKTVTVEVLPPTSFEDPIAIPGFVSSVTDGGVATDALSVTFAGDTLVRPTVFLAYSKSKG